MKDNKSGCPRLPFCQLYQKDDSTQYQQINRKITNAYNGIIILKIYSLCLGIFTTIMSHTRNAIQDLKK